MGDDWDAAAATFDEDADLLVEGNWATGAGLPAERCLELVRRHRGQATVRQLGADSALWGRDVDDERYLLVSG